MAELADHFGALTKAFTGLGVDEQSIIEVLGKWDPDQKHSFRKNSVEIFKEDERQFHRWDNRHFHRLHHEFLRFKDAVVLWTMHPWERDARLVREAIQMGTQYANIIVEVACTRSSDELLGARKAYHSLFDHSIEEDIASKFQSPDKMLLVGLVSAYRYEGPKFSEELAKSEAKTLHSLIKSAANDEKLIEKEEIISILTTRSKVHLRAICQHYQELSGTGLDEEVGDHTLIKQVIQCLCNKEAYFSEVLDGAIRGIEDGNYAKESLTRVIVTRADADLKVIKEVYKERCGVSLPDKIEEIANGNFKNFLLTLIAREE
ncbi:OLC1v1001190C1 [Oldenlandia corymbosa var. corymbosa]|uniref:OLC1v1001190C1 n=1 Tax=Oldenlandia corymbosa var. corymbosa TaxID=529605 RepID=A0AAV1D7P3_OLDCO|nr:OLC1v1001190C1 [Oldenlandia corymbosa var. corymbosa]